MDIAFSSRALQRACNSEKELSRCWGKNRGRTVGRRLLQLAAAANLNVVRAIPAAKLHLLKGDRAGQFAIEVDHSFRLVFIPNHNPVPPHKNGGVDLERVMKIKIIEVIDYHG